MPFRSGRMTLEPWADRAAKTDRDKYNLSGIVESPTTDRDSPSFARPGQMETTLPFARYPISPPGYTRSYPSIH